MQIYFIRHGMTQGNLEKRYVGTTDEGILDTWKKEFNPNNLPEITSLYVSPMKRCIETCHYLYPNQTYEVVEDLKELDFGEFEYKTHGELEKNEIYITWMASNGEAPFPSGESMREFQKRCVDAFQKVIQTELEQGTKSVGFIVHGGTIMALLDAYSNPHRDYYHWQVSNGQGYEGILTKDNDRAGYAITQLKLVRFGDGVKRV